MCNIIGNQSMKCTLLHPCVLSPNNRVNGVWCSPPPVYPWGILAGVSGSYPTKAIVLLLPVYYSWTAGFRYHLHYTTQSPCVQCALKPVLSLCHSFTLRYPVQHADSDIVYNSIKCLVNREFVISNRIYRPINVYQHSHDTADISKWVYSFRVTQQILMISIYSKRHFGQGFPPVCL